MSNTPFHLTYEETRKAARKAYLAGQLGANGKETSCQYHGSVAGLPCAIGAAMPEELRKSLAGINLNVVGVSNLKAEGIVTYTTDDAGKLEELQVLHDDVVRSRDNFGPDHEETRDAIVKFELALGI